MGTKINNSIIYLQPKFIDRLKIIFYKLLGKHELVLKVIKKYKINRADIK